MAGWWDIVVLCSIRFLGGVVFGFVGFGLEEESSLDKLIAIEWDVIYDLRRRLDGDLSEAERVKLSNSLAYHVNTLNRLLAKKGVGLGDEEPLERVIVGLPRRFRRAVVGRIRKWIRSRSSTG